MTLLNVFNVCRSRIFTVFTKENLMLNEAVNNEMMHVLFVLFVLLLYVPSQQLWSWRDGQFT